jgi:glycosyltransferase involved in cell wall biosynthesis
MLRVILQPYYFWDGHYKKYCDSLSSSDSKVIICNKKNAKNFIKINPIFFNYNSNILIYSASRIFSSFQTIIYLLYNFYFKKKIFIHFLEFEPISKIFIIFLNIFFRQRIIFTIHATRLIKDSSIFSLLLFFIQRIFFLFSIFLSNFSTCRFVVHNNENKIFLQKLVFKKRIFLLEYPCDLVSKKKKIFNKKSKKKILIFGQFRRDKGISRFFKNNNIDEFNVTFAGKFIDLELLVELRSNKNFTIINKHVSDKYLSKLILSHDFVMLPYDKKYIGSVGPLKVSLSYGCPVIVSNIEILKNFIIKNKVGIIFNNNSSINVIKNINEKTYRLLSNNCFDYAIKNNWNNFLEKHNFTVYRSFYN